MGAHIVGTLYSEKTQLMVLKILISNWHNCKGRRGLFLPLTVAFVEASQHNTHCRAPSLVHKNDSLT